MLRMWQSMLFAETGKKSTKARRSSLMACNRPNLDSTYRRELPASNLGVCHIRHMMEGRLCIDFVSHRVRTLLLSQSQTAFAWRDTPSRLHHALYRRYQIYFRWNKPPHKMHFYHESDYTQQWYRIGGRCCNIDPRPRDLTNISKRPLKLQLILLDSSEETILGHVSLGTLRIVVPHSFTRGHFRVLHELCIQTYELRLNY